MPIQSVLRATALRGRRAKPAAQPKPEVDPDFPEEDDAGDSLEILPGDDVTDEEALPPEDDYAQDDYAVMDDEDTQPEEDDADVVDAEPDADVPPVKPAAKKPPVKPAAKPAAPAEQEPAEQPDQLLDRPVPSQPSKSEKQAEQIKLAEELARRELAQQQQESDYGVVDDSLSEDGAVDGGATSMRGLVEVLASAGIRFSLQNIREGMLTCLEDFGLINEARKIARLDNESMTTLVANFIPAGKLIPVMFQLGWKPVHQTGINENYPPQERYELTMTNGNMYITVIGKHDWINFQNTTTIRYATDGELRRYGLIGAADDELMAATASGGGRVMYVPSRRYFGATASARTVVYEDTERCMMNDRTLIPEFQGLSRDSNCVAIDKDGVACRCKVLGFLPVPSSFPVVLCLFDDGYALVPYECVYSKAVA